GAGQDGPPELLLGELRGGGQRAEAELGVLGVPRKRALQRFNAHDVVSFKADGRPRTAAGRAPDGRGGAAARRSARLCETGASAIVRVARRSRTFQIWSDAGDQTPTISLVASRDSSPLLLLQWHSS